VELFLGGTKRADIARQLGITPTAVHKALAHHKVIPPARFERMTISAVTMDDYNWLKREAQRSGVKIADIARAMLTDAIAEARDGGA
jgi:predicted transcriptional regulator